MILQTTMRVYACVLQHVIQAHFDALLTEAVCRLITIATDGATVHYAQMSCTATRRHTTRRLRRQISQSPRRCPRPRHVTQLRHVTHFISHTIQRPFELITH